MSRVVVIGLDGLDPRRTALLLIFYRDFPREVRRLMHRGQGPGGGEGPDAPPPEAGLE